MYIAEIENVFSNKKVFFAAKNDILIVAITWTLVSPNVMHDMTDC